MMPQTPQTQEPLKVLTLALEGETFAVDAGIVREILDPVPVTEVPGAPAYPGGIINVRGKIVPLADLRLRFGMEAAASTIDSRIVVVEIEIGDEPTVVGIVADKVYEVTEIVAAEIEETPKIGMHWRPEFIRFIGRREDDFIIVPELDRIFA